jgi:hypothetical protein
MIGPLAMLGTIVVALWLGAAPAFQVPTPVRDPSTVDVCAQVPGTAVAELFGKTLKEQRLVPIKGKTNRCVYILAAPGSSATEGFVLWLYRPEDYHELLEYTEGIVEKPEGLGDEAVLFVDPGDGRSKLRLLVREKFSLEVSASNIPAARKLAKLALDRFSR